MRCVLQRVTRASVAVDGEIISSIGRGLLILVGIERNDTQKDASILLKKILSAKLFDDPGEAWGGWKRSVKDVEGEILCVSQFTLMAQFKGAKPDFHDSMPSTQSRDFYFNFLKDLGDAYDHSKIKNGKFGGIMEVSLVNDGPLTIILSSLDSRTGKTKSRDDTPLTSGASTPAIGGNGDSLQGLTGIDKWKAKMKAKQDKQAAGTADGQAVAADGAAGEGVVGKKNKGKNKFKGDRYPNTAAASGDSEAQTPTEGLGKGDTASNGVIDQASDLETRLDGVKLDDGESATLAK